LKKPYPRKKQMELDESINLYLLKDNGTKNTND